MTNKHNNISKYIFQSVAALFIISLFVTASLFTYAQEEAPATEKANDLPYELGVVLVQYEDTVFQAQVNDGGEAGVVQVPGGLLDNLDGDLGPVAIVNDLLTEEGFAPKLIERFPDLNAEVIHLGEDVDPLSVMDSLIALPGVVLVQPNFLYEPTQAPNDPKLSDAWHLIHTQVYSTDQSDNETAWKAIDGLTTATYVPTIAVIDTGIDTEHPEFKDVSANRDKPQFNRLLNLSHCNLPVFNLDTEPDRTKSTTTTCPWGGYNFAGNSNDVRHSARGSDINAGIYSSASYHGTRVAGVAAANRDNELGAVGVAPFAHIMPIRVAFADTRTILKSVAFARLNGADVINASFGTSHPNTLCSHLYRSGRTSQSLLEYQQIRNFPGLFVAAAGNQGRRISDNGHSFDLPADFNQDMSAQGCWDAAPNVLSVGGTEKGKDIDGDTTLTAAEEATVAAQGIDEVRWKVSEYAEEGSNYSAGVDIAAPAQNIVLPSVTTVDGQKVYGTEAIEGTSFSAPQVAGVVALMLRANKDLTTAQIKQRLLESADELVALVGPDCEPGTVDDYVYRGRRLNAYNAVRAALDLPYTKKRVSDLTDAQKNTCLQGGKDLDGNGLIEINTAEQLYNMRHNLAGTSYKTSSTDPGVTTGCPSTGCYGYELVHDVDLRDTPWETAGWMPIDGFSGTFKNNRYFVYYLSSVRPSSAGHRIFGTSDAAAKVQDPVFYGDAYWGCDSGTRTGCVLQSANHLSTASGSCSGGGVGSCSYRCEKGSWVEVTNTCPQAVSCVTDLGTLSNDTVSQQGSFGSGCESTVRLRSYAHYYTFTLSEQKKVTIDLAGNAGSLSITRPNAYLYLSNNTSTKWNRSGSIITSDDHSGATLGAARITRVLSPGTYTIEATTAYSAETGPYTMRVSAAAVTISNCPGNTNHLWRVGNDVCTGVLQPTAVNASQTVVDQSGSTTGSVTYHCDVNGYLTETDVTCSRATVTCPAADKTWVQGSATCQGSMRAAPAGSARTIADQLEPTVGSATYQCGTDGRWSAVGNVTCMPGVCPSVDQAWTVGHFVCRGSTGTATAGSVQSAVDAVGSETGSASYRCGVDGRWTATGNAVCVAVACPAISNQEWLTANGRRRCSADLAGAVPGDSQTITDTTAPTAGSATYQCGTDGRWTKTSGTCDLITCPAVVNQTWTVSGSTCDSPLVSVLAGESMRIWDREGPTIGAAEYQCGVDGAWVKTGGNCVSSVKTCPSIASQVWEVNGNTCTRNRSIPTTAIGESATVLDTNRPTIGVATYRCGTDGTWTRTSAICNEIATTPPDPEG